MPFSPKIHWKRFQVDQRKLFLSNTAYKKPYKAKCAVTVIAYNKMKTVHDKDFLKALLICKSVISYTFGIMLICDIFTQYPLFSYPQFSDFLIFAYRDDNSWRSING